MNRSVGNKSKKPKLLINIDKLAIILIILSVLVENMPLKYNKHD